MIMLNDKKKKKNFLNYTGIIGNISDFGRLLLCHTDYNLMSVPDSLSLNLCHFVQSQPLLLSVAGLEYCCRII